MRLGRYLACLGFLLIAVPARGQEIVLKDGTKIVGKMVAIRGDSIEVQTVYGKIKVPTANIVTISFPENQPKQPSEEKPKPLEVNEKLEGSTYTNTTGNFRLTLLPGWKTSEELRREYDGALAGLTSADETVFFMVSEETFSRSLQAYKGIAELDWKKNFKAYEKLSESDLIVKGKPALRVIFRGVSSEAGGNPVKFLIMFVSHDGKVTSLMGWTIEPLFGEVQDGLEKIALSYESIPK